MNFQKRLAASRGRALRAVAVLLAIEFDFTCHGCGRAITEGYVSNDGNVRCGKCQGEAAQRDVAQAVLKAAKVEKL